MIINLRVQKVQIRVDTSRCGKGHNHYNRQKFLSWSPCFTGDWWNACWFQSEGSFQIKLVYSHLIAVDVFCHQWSCIISNFEGFVRNLPVFSSLANPSCQNPFGWLGPNHQLSNFNSVAMKENLKQSWLPAFWKKIKNTQKVEQNAF